MAVDKAGDKRMSIKVTLEAAEAIRIAAAFKGKTVQEYASEILLAAAERDIEEGYRQRGQGQQSPAKGKRAKGD